MASLSQDRYSPEESLWAEVGRKTAVSAYELTIQSTFADVENSLIARKKLIQQVEVLVRLAKANNQYSCLALLRYEDGYAPYSMVLQAEQQLCP
jgi:outer membrane protein, multidrug efflux system